MRKTIFFIFVFLCCWISFSSSLSYTAELTPEEERLRKEEITREIEKVEFLLPYPKKVLQVRYGSWIISTLREFKNTDNDKSSEDTLSTSWLNEIRLWASLTYQQKYTLYLRLKEGYIQRRTGQGYTGIGDDNGGTHLDTGYLKLNFSGINKRTSELKMGRQHIYVGRGISYSDISDGVKFSLPLPQSYFKVFLSHTLPHEDNIDTSVPNYEKEGERLFFGTEISYIGLANNIFYAYSLIQRDLTDKNPISTQNYRYNSQYFGVGFDGIFKKKLNYWFEVIKENGKSFTDTNSVALEKKEIDAWAMDIGSRYEFNVGLHPACEIEYAWGSGDKDRSSVTDTKSGGNQRVQDENFLYFGSFFSGYALSPRLSNLRIFKIDVSLKPLEKLFPNKDISWGVKYFTYRKDVAEGGIYDTDATVVDKNVGSEIDTYVYLRTSKNLYFAIRYGIFYPGDAYPNNTNNNAQYFYARLTLSF